MSISVICKTILSYISPGSTALKIDIRPIICLFRDLCTIKDLRRQNNTLHKSDILDVAGKGTDKNIIDVLD